MALNILDSVSTSTTGLQASAKAAITATTTPENQKKVVSTITLTSISGATTTVVTYSDGSTKTTLSEGDSVVLTSKTTAKI